MRYLIAVAALFWATVSLASAAESREQTHEIKIGTGYTYHSDFMDEDIQYFVAPPYTYEKDTQRKYPVIYVFDGHIPNVSAVHALAKDLWGYGPEMPEVIVVGILSNNRRRDYTPVATDLDSNGNKSSTGVFMKGGGASKYREFLRSDFMPHIEKLYRANGHRILIGHSLGGVFAIDDLISENRLFHSYIAIDPALWFAGNHVLKQLETLEDKSLDAPGSLYVSMATRGLDLSDASLGAGDRGKQDRFDLLKKLLAKKTAGKFRFQITKFP